MKKKTFIFVLLLVSVFTFCKLSVKAAQTEEKANYFLNGIKYEWETNILNVQQHVLTEYTERSENFEYTINYILRPYSDNPGEVRKANSSPSGVNYDDENDEYDDLTIFDSESSEELHDVDDVLDENKYDGTYDDLVHGYVFNNQLDFSEFVFDEPGIYKFYLFQDVTDSPTYSLDKTVWTIYVSVLNSVDDDGNIQYDSDGNPIRVMNVLSQGRKGIETSEQEKINTARREDESRVISNFYGDATGDKKDVYFDIIPRYFISVVKVIRGNMADPTEKFEFELRDFYDENYTNVIDYEWIEDYEGVEGEENGYSAMHYETSNTNTSVKKYYTDYDEDAEGGIINALPFLDNIKITLGNNDRFTLGRYVLSEDFVDEWGRTYPNGTLIYEIPYDSSALITENIDEDEEYETVVCKSLDCNVEFGEYGSRKSKQKSTTILTLMSDYGPESDENNTYYFINTKESALLTGVKIEYIPYVILFVASISGIVILFRKKAKI